MDCRACQTPLPTDARFCMTCGADVTDPGATQLSTPRSQMEELEARLARTLSGRYHVRKLLGSGGMAAVFLADELGLDRPVAIKVLPPELSRDRALVARFEREAKTAAKLDHPHIIPIHRVESESGLHYFVMKYVPGRSLDELLDAEEPLSLDMVTRILYEAALALGHAHARGVVHRDVKPANIMLDPNDRVVLTDFGISKAGESASLTQTGMIVGTPHYMAPEQALGLDVDGRADQYALSVVGYHMLTRQRPFEGDSAHTILYRHIHEPPRPLTTFRADVSAHLVQAITIAMAKQKDERFATMEEFARAISGDDAALAARAATVNMTRTGTPELTPSRVPTQPLAAIDARASTGRSRRTALWTGAAAAALLAAVITWLATDVRARASYDDGSPPPSAASAERIADAPHDGAPTSGGTPDASVSKVRSERTSGSAVTVPRPESTPVVRDSETTPAREARRASLTVASDPYGVLYIDNVQIGDTPVVDHRLEVGRKYQIRVERDGYVTKRETITVDGPNPIRRNYALDISRQP